MKEKELKVSRIDFFSDNLFLFILAALFLIGGWQLGYWILDLLALVMFIWIAFRYAGSLDKAGVKTGLG